VNVELHDAVELRLRAIGQRYTPKRRALVDALVRASQPVAVPDLARGRGLPQSSLYRNLAVLEQAGAVHRVMTHEEFGRYELAEDLTQHHHHLVCRSCGAVEDVTVAPSLERQVQRSLVDVEDRTGFSAVGHRLDLIGTCRNCS
jgi:Fur family transcriptional regulator, ferric uptake regulator